MMPSTKSNNKLKSKTFIFEAIGTKWTIDIRTPLLQNEADLLFEKILTRIDEFDKNYSRFRSDSLVTEMSRVTGHYRLPNDAKKMLDLYEKLYSLTKGLMTPLIGKSLEEAGYDANYSLTEIYLN